MQPTAPATSSKTSVSVINVAASGHLELLPASYRTPDDMMEIPAIDEAFLVSQLDLSRLNRLYNMFWMVGRPMPSRPLHYQRTLSRDIFITEEMDMHLVWTSGRIYLKPIPRFLLNPDFWSGHLQCTRFKCQSYDPNKPDTGEVDGAFCMRCRFHRIALGFLWSYTALIPYESDFHIAKSNYLIPMDTDWRAWKEFVKQILINKDIHLQIHPRFLYGELRLSRLNKLHRISHRQLFRGYASGYNRYVDFLHDKFTALASVVVYIGVVLAGMQVGLQTSQLQNSRAFNAVSYGFTVFAIAAPIAITAIIIMVAVVWAVVNVKATLRYKKQRLETLNLSSDTTAGKSKATAGSTV